LIKNKFTIKLILYIEKRFMNLFMENLLNKNMKNVKKLQKN